MMRPPYFSCNVERTAPTGTVETYRFVTPSGTSDASSTNTWTSPTPEDGIRVHAVWGDAGAAEAGYVHIGYVVPDDDLYRVQFRRAGMDDISDLQLQSGLKRRVNGQLQLFMDWGPLTAFLAGAPDPRVIVLDAEGNVVRSDAVDPAAMTAAPGIAAGLRRELDAMTADYRNRCELVESLEPQLPPPQPTP